MKGKCMAHETEWCEICQKQVPKGHSMKHHGKKAKVNYLSPAETTVGKFWTTD